MAYISFHQLFEEARQSAGMSHDRLAARAWTSPSYTFRICDGKAKPSRDVVIRLCIALNLGVDDTDALLRAAGHVGLVDLDKRESRSA